MNLLQDKINILNLKSNLLLLITEYLDAKTLILHFDKTCKAINNIVINEHNYISSLNYKINILNNNSTNLKKVYSDEYNTELYQNNILSLLNDNVLIFNFIINLLRTEIFFIGGSFALLNAMLLKNISFNLEDFEDRDIDIYIIKDIKPNELQKILSKILDECLVDLECFIEIKKFIINIEFKNPDIKKIQIILHTRKSIEEYLEFTDFPCTQFILGYNKLYYTKLALFAIEYKINILDMIYNNISYNRIEKYFKRGFYTIKCIKYGIDNKLRIICIYEPLRNKILEHKIDCFLEDIIRLKKRIDNNEKIILVKNKLDISIKKQIVPKLKIITEKLTIYENKFDESILLNFLFDMNILKNTISVSKSEKIKNINSYVHDLYGDYTVLYERIKDIREKQIIKFHNKFSAKYKYKFNERNIYKNFYEEYMDKYNNNNNKMKNYPYFMIFKSSDFKNIKKNLFFSNYNSYFLNNNLIKYGIDDKYYSIYSIIVEKNLYIPNFTPKKIIDHEGFTLINRKKF